jgi:hypothetical protein
MADPRRMTPEEHGQAHALLVRAVTDPDWQAASQALDDLMGSCWWCVGCWRPRSASPRARRGPTRCNGSRPQALDLLNRSMKCGRSPAWPPRREPPALRLQAATRQVGTEPGSRARASHSGGQGSDEGAFGFPVWLSVDRNVPDRPQAAPCSPNRAAAGPAACTSGDQEGHRAVPSPDGAEGPSLWPSTLERSYSCCALAGQGR